MLLLYNKNNEQTIVNKYNKQLSGLFINKVYSHDKITNKQ